VEPTPPPSPGLVNTSVEVNKEEDPYIIALKNVLNQQAMGMGMPKGEAKKGEPKNIMATKSPKTSKSTKGKNTKRRNRKLR